jgi:hypothetical protein
VSGLGHAIAGGEVTMRISTRTIVIVVLVTMVAILVLRSRLAFGW